MNENDLNTTQDSVDTAWTVYLQEHSAPEAFHEHEITIKRLWRHSNYAMQQCQRHPHIVSTLINLPLIPDQSTQHLQETLIQALSAVNDENDFKRVIRQFRHEQLVIICWRDLVRNEDVQTLLQAISNVADVCVQQSVVWCQKLLADKYGQALTKQGERANFIVVALGKLGGQELNFSSDIDLVFLYSAAGQTNLEHSITNQEFFTLFAQKLIDLLATLTVDGFVYRVDCRLRPFGDSGPLVVHLDSLEEYLYTHGREWERYALIKARCLTGSSQDMVNFNAIVNNFVYRKYIDFGVLNTLREMKDLISQQVQQRNQRDNIKLGQGGIREVEFVIQFFQLVYGGRHLDLQTASIFQASQSIVAKELLEKREVQQLLSAYKFLRRCENRLQMFNDEQTHDLPNDPDKQIRLANSMQYETFSLFEERLIEHRSAVDQIFMKIRSNGESADIYASYQLIWNKFQQLDQDSGLSLIMDLGFDSASVVQGLIMKLINSAAYKNQDAQGRARLNKFMPLFLYEINMAKLTQDASTRIFIMIQNLARRSIYLVMLAENQKLLSQLIKVCAASPWITNHLGAYPLLMDELMHPLNNTTAQNQKILQNDFTLEVLNHCDLDYEQVMERVRYFKHTHELRVACADVEGALSLMDVSDHLSWMAEVVVSGCLSYLGKSFDQTSVDRVGVVAFGKLGGLEMGYGSDLDLVFMCKNSSSEQHSYPQDLDATTKNTLLIQRLTQMLTLQTVSGKLYEVDTRLRPDGAAGAMVPSIEQMQIYYQQRAWVWELQALVRARCIVGDSDLKQQFNQMRENILSQQREVVTLQKQVAEMRIKMMARKSSRDEQKFHLKHDRGGITDIEFMVQYMVLAYAHKHTNLCAYTDNIQLLGCLSDLEIITTNEAQELSEIYREYRQTMHVKALHAVEAEVSSEEYILEREIIGKYWHKIIGS